VLALLLVMQVLVLALVLGISGGSSA
jgi:hypothetical protein